MSTGHDEYWSGTQRANVEAARDAGVNLAFFSGNEVYWKTRYEPSVDGTNTAGPHAHLLQGDLGQRQDRPVDREWTGTWRDPRFSPPADGGKPENALTGTAFMSNSDDLTMQVPAAQGKLRLWRNTSVANLAAGQTATLAPHTVGYESDEDLDNGFRPAGLIRLSTTTGATPEYLRDFGQRGDPGHDHAQHDALPGGQRRAGLRGRHHPVRLGPGHPTTTARRPRPTCGCSSSS